MPTSCTTSVAARDAGSNADIVAPDSKFDQASAMVKKDTKRERPRCIKLKAAICTWVMLYPTERMEGEAGNLHIYDT